MRLVPCARVSIIYSHVANLKMKRPKIAMNEKCVYTSFSNPKFVLAGKAIVNVIKKN